MSPKIPKPKKPKPKTTSLSETALYLPVKKWLETQGYEVKAEIGAADVVGMRAHEDPVIVELKTTFSLSLLHQAIDRQSITDNVYVAVPRKPGKAAYKILRKNKSLCRRLGLGLLTIRPKDNLVEMICAPAPFTPRKSKKKQAKLLKDFTQLSGDPNKGGQTRQGLMTGYRQDALRCLKVLFDEGATKASIVKDLSGVARARNIMADNHYGWFEKVERGVYGVTDAGAKAVIEFGEEILFLLPTSETIS